MGKRRKKAVTMKRKKAITGNGQLVDKKQDEDFVDNKSQYNSSAELIIFKNPEINDYYPTKEYSIKKLSLKNTYKNVRSILKNLGMGLKY